MIYYANNKTNIISALTKFTEEKIQNEGVYIHPRKRRS